jgi:DNA-binding response OmpR family regulator
MNSVLIVDDEPKVCDALTRLLRHAGYDVHPAGTGREALAIAQRTVIDLALLDIALPDMPGTATEP